MEGNAIVDSSRTISNSTEYSSDHSFQSEILLPTEKTAETAVGDDEREEDPKVDEVLARVLETPCFEPLDGTCCSYLYTTQLTCSNVVSTVVTSRICRQDQQPLSASIERVKEAARGGRPANFGGPNQESDAASTLSSVYGASQSRKLPRKRKVGSANSKYQAQLPAFRRSLPALPIPISRLNQELRQVRLSASLRRAVLVTHFLFGFRNEMHS